MIQNPQFQKSQIKSVVREKLKIFDLILTNPARILAVSFFALCIFGAFILYLPISSSTGTSIAFIDAVFTSFSSVCVTGLTVMDTPNDFSFTGQMFVLLLIQLGGLGIMSFSVAVLVTLGKRLSLKYEKSIAGSLGSQDSGKLFGYIQTIFFVTFGIEAIGAILLFIFFLLDGYPFFSALWHGIFISVSAYCNAGFSLFSDNLILFKQNSGIIFTVSLLIIAGGLSPFLVIKIPRIFSKRALSIEAKLIFIVTSFLLLSGSIFFLLFEWNTSLHGLSLFDKIANSWFQSVTTRTAGFNSLEMGKIRSETFVLFLILMFIGGSPGGMAGGIKTTTFAVLMLGIRGTLNLKWQASVFQRRISHRSFYKASAIVFIAIFFHILFFLLLLLTQNIPAREVIFEVVSALGTVGLSVGATSKLDGVGKLIIVVCMYIGRIGSLTMFWFLMDQKSGMEENYIEMEIDVG
ncbi:MAG: hypothetical protein H7A23_24880 [Leptospiraceae bacterium]|nr:TrkH family potassium uptake protein [Leptospiraceae bacterium]MCP5497801.1 hypothetical protein [Leptospiraceae bacterium]